MSREPHIPLFLWIATAIVAHAIWGGGAHQAATVLEETLDIGAFAREVQQHVRRHSTAVEVSLLDDVESPSLEMPPEIPSDSATDDADPSELPEEEALLEKKKEEEEEKKREEQEQAEEKPEPKPEEKKEPEKKDQAEPPPPVQIKVPNRVAVEQHVEDENQEDNPDAEHIAEHANRVEQETRARITSTDQNARDPSPGDSPETRDLAPGNSDETRVAQSEDAPGDPDRAPTASGDAPQEAAASLPQAGAAKPVAGGDRTPRAPAPSPPRAAQAEQQAVPHVHDHSSGRWSLARPLEEQSQQRAVPRRQTQNPTDFLGLGASGTTRNGINLNLTQQMAVAAVGADQLARERRLDGERRKSAHRGSWQSLGIERWKPALENYVASVQPGNQTALNTARVPFARYLNAIHLRIHPVFADRFLSTLDSLPKDHPLNREDMSTHLEIVLSKEDGRIVRMGITKTSGVTAFDVGALDSVQKASPFGAPPDVIVSPDNNVYLHWEFHRLPNYACSTYFARPYILKAAPRTAPPRVPAPTQPAPEEGSYAPEPEPGERSGSLHQREKRAAGSSG